MIDIDKLRRLAQAATPGPWIATGPSFGGSLPKYLNEVVVDREGDEGDGYSICNTPIGLDEECSDDMAFIAAANPAAISELLDRLEAAETELAELRSSMKFRTSLIGRTEAERDALRAKIAEMEKQEPAKHEFQGRDGVWYPFINQRHYENTVADGSWPVRALYALPGAQAQPAPAQSTKDDIISDLQSQFDTEGITEYDSGDALIRLSDAIAAVEDNFALAQPAPSVPDGWQLVPSAKSRHPGIYKMLGALHAADNTPGMSEWESYQAMLAAAPKPEAKP